jgi:AcrR family transcriptional regulator
VFEAAARVFHERGYEQTSIQDIADDIGILKGSLYYYIDTKEDLLHEILWRVHEDALANIRRVEEIEGDALTKIRAFVTLHITFNMENLVRMGVFHHDFRSLSPERRQDIVEARDLYDKMLRELFREGQNEGVVCPDVNPKLATLATLGMCNWVYQWFRPGGPLKPAEVADQFADLVVAGVACTPKTHSPGHRAQLGALPTDFARSFAAPTPKPKPKAAKKRAAASAE